MEVAASTCLGLPAAGSDAAAGLPCGFVVSVSVYAVGLPGAGASAPQSPLRLDTTFGGRPAPSDVTSVLRVQVFEPLLVLTIVTLELPAGALP